MPVEHVHYSIGVTMGSVITLASMSLRIVRRNFRKVLVIWPIFMTACGLFALIPDALTVLCPFKEKSFWHGPLADICFFHRWFDELNHGYTPEQDIRFSVMWKIIGYSIYNLLIIVYIIYIRRLKTGGRLP